MAGSDLVVHTAGPFQGGEPQVCPRRFRHTFLILPIGPSALSTRAAGLAGCGRGAGAVHGRVR